MDNPPRLQPGSQVRCPHCRRWHPAIKPYTEGTDYTRLMLFVECRGLRYYVGQQSLEPINVTGEWVQRPPPGVVGQTTVMSLAQSGTTVTGTWQHTADHLVSSGGPVSGTVTGVALRFSADVRTESKPKPGTNEMCRVQTVRLVTTLTVSGDTMSGTLVFSPTPCQPRANISQTVWERR